jgi:hypothetical protein
MSIEAFFEGYDSPNLQDIVHDPSDLLIRAFQEQEEIGWDQWMKGRLSKTWGIIYGVDLSHINHNIPHQTPDRWGKKLVATTFNFVLECWICRIEAEHGLNDDPIRTKKDKLIAKIMWQKDKIKFFPNRYLRNLKKEDLHDLPMDNLIMTESQMEISIRASKWKVGVPRDTEIE